MYLYIHQAPRYKSHSVHSLNSPLSINPGGNTHIHVYIYIHHSVVYIHCIPRSGVSSAYTLYLALVTFLTATVSQVCTCTMIVKVMISHLIHKQVCLVIIGREGVARAT